MDYTDSLEAFYGFYLVIFAHSQIVVSFVFSNSYSIRPRKQFWVAKIIALA